MTWDDTAKKVAIHAIGAVEASMDYGAVNPVDPISIGLFQWYGTRAADLLFQIQSGNPSTFTGVSATITTDMSAHPATDTWWNNRYVSAAEIATLAPMLRQNVAIQSTLAGNDLETYRQAGESAGLNADTNSETMEFFVNMYNQGPRYAFQVLGQVGGDATLEQIYNACLNHPVLGVYKSRYKTAYDIIVAQDTTGVGDPTGNPPPPDPNPPGGDPTGNTQPTTDIQYVESRADSLYVHHKDGHVSLLAPTGRSQWTPAKDSSLGGGPPVTTPPSAPPDPTKAGAVVQWMIDHLGDFAYSQGPCRISPGLPCGYSDCSGTVREAYRVGAGIIIGTWTGDEYLNGTMVGNTLDYAMGSGPQDGDLIFLKWPGNSGKVYDHVEMFSITQKGPNGEEILSHGGPGNGPVWQHRSYDFSYAVKLQVNRYL